MSETGREITLLRNKGAEIRESEIQDKLEQALQGGNDSKRRERCLKHILRTEREAKMWRRLRVAAGKTKNATGVSVSVPEGYRDVNLMWDALKLKREDPERMKWERMTDPQQVEELLLEWCARHFAQTNDTPLSSGRWRDWLDPRSSNNKIDEILSGAGFMDTEERQAIREIIEAAKRPEGWVTSKADLSFDHFMKFCKKQEEKKTSSPSGRHYGHMKACAEEPEILKVIFDIANLSYINKKPLDRWQRANDILLRKDGNNDRVHRFRNITIIEGDLQYIMKTVWGKNLMDAAEEVQSTAQNCRRGRVAQSSVLGHRLAMDIIKTQGGEAVVIENDAVNCYDRILVELGAVSTMRMGLPKESAEFMVTVLKQMRHHIAMGEYVSERFVASGLTNIFDGTGQGTGWAPAIWQNVFDIVLTAMEKFQPGIILKSPDGRIVDKRTVEGHVDDSRQLVNTEGIKQYNIENGTDLKLLEGARQASQGFGNYLNLTGGRLAIEKTVSYHLKTEVQGSRIVFRKKVDGKQSIEVTENFGQEIMALKGCKANEARKMLGVWMAPELAICLKSGQSR